MVEVRFWTFVSCFFSVIFYVAFSHRNIQRNKLHFSITRKPSIDRPFSKGIFRPQVQQTRPEFEFWWLHIYSFTVTSDRPIHHYQSLAHLLNKYIKWCVSLANNPRPAALSSDYRRSKSTRSQGSGYTPARANSSFAATAKSVRPPSPDRDTHL